jgi:hypothetical protein
VRCYSTVQLAEAWRGKALDPLKAEGKVYIEGMEIAGEEYIAA